MEEKIKQLYTDIRKIVFDYLILKKRNIVERAWEIFPQIQEFSSWFLLKNEFNIEKDIYLYMKIRIFVTKL